jgi:hypothetical protein
MNKLDEVKAKGHKTAAAPTPHRLFDSVRPAEQQTVLRVFENSPLFVASISRFI